MPEPQSAGLLHPVMKAISRVLLAILVLGCTPAAVRAQIYTWRDADGNLVLSDKPKDPAAQTYRVARAGLFRSTRPISQRATRFDGLIEEQAAANDVSPALVRAVIQAESAFNPSALSHKGAMGLMQLMPATAREYRVRNPFDPKSNIEAGIKHLKSLIDRFGVELGLAAYNAGEGAIRKFNGFPPYRETRNYVSKILSLAGLK